MNRVFQVKTPATIVFGVGSRKQLPQFAKELSEGPFLIVTDPGLVKAGVVKEIEVLMSEAGLQVSVFDNVVPDPEVETVGQCLEAVRSAKAAMVIGVGGGSALDIAKTADNKKVFEDIKKKGL